MVKEALVRKIGGKENRFVQSLRKYAEGREGPCDKCGQPVPSWNNAAIFEFINTSGNWLNGLNLNRHLLPVVDDNGVVLCEGSPSRSKYLTQGMADDRKEYPFIKEDAVIAPVCLTLYLTYEVKRRAWQYDYLKS